MLLLSNASVLSEHASEGVRESVAPNGKFLIPPYELNATSKAGELETKANTHELDVHRQRSRSKM